MNHTPLSKSLRDLTAEDIKALQTDAVPEGYRIEYKSAFPSRDKLANSIASFANSSGGWYFVGIRADRPTNAPTDFPGIRLGDLPDPVSTFRETVKALVSPIPSFEVRLLQIDSDRHVLAVHIPEGDDTPYYTRDGKIYRRVADSSDPLPENDRHAIDRLVDKGRAANLTFEDFCNDPRILAHNDEPWLSVFLKPALPPPERPDDWISSQHVASARSEFSSQTQVPFTSGVAYFDANIPFHTAVLGHDALILRHQPKNDLVTPNLEIELFHDGRCRLFVPIISRPAWTSANIGSIVSLKTRNVIATRYTSPSFGRLSFFDVRDLWFVLGLLVTSYETHLRVSSGVKEADAVPFRWRFQLRRVANTVAFVDDDSWADFASESNLPVIQHDVITVPEPHAYQRPLIATEDIPLWGQLATRICVSLGLPLEVLASFRRSQPPRDA